MFCVYKLTCRVNGKVYIGKTNNLVRRNIEHESEARRGRRNQRLYNAIRKHGWVNFDSSVIAEFDDVEAAYRAEEFFIAFFNATGSQGYNCTTGGEGTRGLSEEGRRRMSAFAKTRTGVKNGFFGKTHTPEARRRMAAARAQFRGERHHFWGKTHTESTKRKISQTKQNQQRRWSEEERRQIGLRSAGEKCVTAKITNTQAVELRELFTRGTPAKELQAIFGLSKAAVYRVINRQTFKEC